jgi:hypothetical protein
LENLNEINNLGDLDVDGRIILKCIFIKENVRVWTGIILMSSGLL